MPVRYTPKITVYSKSVKRFVLDGYTLSKFWWYNKVNLGELVPLEILGDHYQGLRGYPERAEKLFCLLFCLETMKFNF